MKIKSAINMYLAFARLGKATELSYRSVLGRLADHLGHEYLVARILPDQITGFIASLNLDPQTALTYWKIINTFFRWLHSTHPGFVPPPVHRFSLVPANPALAISEADLAALLEKSGPKLRDKLIIRFMADTGMDSAAVAALRRTDLNPQNLCMVFAYEHGHRQMMFIEEATHQLLLAWLARHPGGEWLFPASDGKKLSSAAVRMVVYRTAQKAGIEVSLEGFYHRIGLRYMQLPLMLPA